MTIASTAGTLKDALNKMSPGQMADALRALGFGELVRALPVQLNDAKLDGAAATNPYVVAAGQSIALPDDAKASVILRAFARAGTGTKGLLTVDVDSNSEPSAGHCAVSANGDLVFQHADAWTALDILYVPLKYTLVEVTLPLTSSNTTATLPSKALVVLEAEGLAGGTPGKKIIDIPGGTPSAGNASLSFSGATVLFATGDAHTSVRIKYAAVPAIDVNALLAAASNLL